ncbi:MAG: 3-phosphoshikimate 1-carboxyvinyltransferase [Acidobacteria bacterium]|jgi:3-phosphoshikimate 1-carboxyvinyltransferase|nr:MAG: 3-phosphoshikimate 1-carboxyvinyltransferase [Acidobacteriota bacterium]GIU82077.1 MAG: 3-phosphoshikimate 1-carboxyvinyltransferase [Pyrinomonadaceae bacterium]
MNVKIKPAKRLKGTVYLPGDKSISHRAAILSAIAEGTSRIENFSTSADCNSTLKCLESLGISIVRNGKTVLVKGVGKDGFIRSSRELDCGNSGTTARLLAGVLAGQSFESILIGDESLSKRPMKRIIEPLEMMGAKIESKENCLPLKIRGKRPLKAISYQMPVASAQVKSCILLAGLFADGKTTVSEAVIDGETVITRDHTERMLRYFGVDVEIFDGKISVSGNAKLGARNFTVPCDISSAAFFLVAASCLKDSEVFIPNVSINPTRTAILKVLMEIGAKIEIRQPAFCIAKDSEKDGAINDERAFSDENAGEPVADLVVYGVGQFQTDTLRIQGAQTASLIDEIPILAVLGTQLEGGLEVRDAKELRVKESDRISAIVENLRRMGVEVEEFSDGFCVKRSRLKATKIDSKADHRIAMAFAVAALLAEEGETEIDQAECVSVSFPDFFQTLFQMTNF